jgi:hypothetical protein
MERDIQLYRGGDRDRDRRTPQWRADRIKRFTEGQRQKREWINFAEIAEWCSEEHQSIKPNEEKRATAFDTLARDLLSGEFEENGRSRVLYLHPDVVWARMTRERLREAINHNYDGNAGRSQYLSHCWIRRRSFDRWLAKHRLEQSPARFQPRDEVTLAKLKRAKRGRPAEYNWDGVKSKLTMHVSEHGVMQSFDELLQKCADFASEDHPKKKTPDDSTIRAAIKSHRLDAVVGVASEK